MEAVAAFALACNALQVIGYGKDTLLLLRDFYKHGSLKAHQSVAEHAKQLSRPTEELQSLIQQTEASGKVLTAQQRQLRDTAGECIEVSRTLQDELAQLKKKDGDGVRVAISKVFKTMRRKGSIKEMETILSKYQTILDKWMLVNLT